MIDSISKIKVIRPDDERVKYLAQKDVRIGKLIELIGELEYSLNDNPYKYLVETIIGQLISVKAANAIIERLKEKCDGEITLSAMNKLSVEDIRRTGTSTPKAKYIKGITDAVMSGELDFSALDKMDTDSAMKELKKIKGIGNWTAKMYALSFLDGADILPVCDVAFMRACKWFYNRPDLSPKEMEELGKKWSPYSSVATRYLYRCLSHEIIKEEIKF